MCNGSYGLTTLHNRHVKIIGPKISFSFQGKSGKQHEIDVHDRRLAQIVKRSQDLPGEELFAYEDEAGQARDVTSQDVNAYLREISGQDFSAKDFRTWAGTVLAAMALREFEQVTNNKQAKKNVVTAIEAVAKMLGNTAAVCRKCYVHPAILDSYLQGAMIEVLNQRVGKRLARSLSKLKPKEAAVLALLRRRLAGVNGQRSTGNGSRSTVERRRRTVEGRRSKASITPRGSTRISRPSAFDLRPSTSK